MTYLSPTSFNLWRCEPEAFVRKYVHGQREPENLAMAVGSGFDYLVKKALAADFGLGEVEPLQSTHVDYALLHGQRCFDAYRPVYLKLVRELKNPVLVGEVRREMRGVPLMGKPDLVDGQVVLDWKVNAYLKGKSPTQGYVRLWQEGVDRGPHKRCKIRSVSGWLVNGGDGIQILEQTRTHRLNACGIFDENWAIQLYFYAAFINPICAIDQVLGGDCIRVAQHRFLLPDWWVSNLEDEIVRCWDHIQREHYFPDLPFEESKAYSDSLALKWFQ